MNERIQELAREAGAQGLATRDFIDVERFARLIVGECADLCSATAAGRDAEAIEAAILEHFGVDKD
jgi:hypothetical protein